MTCLSCAEKDELIAELMKKCAELTDERNQLKQFLVAYRVAKSRVREAQRELLKGENNG